MPMRGIRPQFILPFIGSVMIRRSRHPKQEGCPERRREGLQSCLLHRRKSRLDDRLPEVLTSLPAGVKDRYAACEVPF